jgi:hypothetical protein
MRIMMRMIDRDHHGGWTGHHLIGRIRRRGGGRRRCGSKIRHGRCWPMMDEMVHIGIAMDGYCCFAAFVCDEMSV